MKSPWKYVFGLLGIIIGIVIIKSLFKPKKMETKTKEEKSDESKNYTEADAMDGIDKIKNEFGTEIARRVEQIFRLETGNFKSTAYRKTGSAGRLWIEKYDKNKPKWCVWIKPIYKDGKLVKNAIVPAGTEGSKKYCYVVYNSVYDAMLGLANYLKKYGIDEGTMRWGHGTNIEEGKKYLAQVKSITPKFA